MKKVTSLVLVLTIMVLLCLACTKKTPPNVNDPTQPTVEIKVKTQNGQYEVVPSALVPQSLDLMCVVTDADGVLSVKLEFFGDKTDKCEVGDDDKFGLWLVKFPDSQQVTLQADDKVATILPIYFSLPQPKCQTDAGEGKPPGGYVFKARCTGRNWNPQSNPVVKELELKIQ